MDTQTLQLTKEFIASNPVSVIGFAMPVLLDFLNSYLSEQTTIIKILKFEFSMDLDFKKSLLAVLICFGAAALFKWNELTAGSWASIVNSFFIVYGESQGLYKLWFKNSTWRTHLLNAIYGNSQVDDNAIG